MVTTSGRHVARRRLLRNGTVVAAAAGVLLAAGAVTAVLAVGPAADDRDPAADTAGMGTAPAPGDSTTPDPGGVQRGDPGRTQGQPSPAPGGERGGGPPPELAGMPGPDNTGVPAGTQLTASGSLTVTEDGAEISGLDIDGCVDIEASDVTIRNSRIRCDREHSAVRVADGATGLLMEDVEIDGQGVTSVTICCGNYTLRRADIHNTIDGPRLGSNSVIEDSWIHHLHRTADSHNDALQTTGAVNMVVRHNRLDAYNPDSDDPFNAAIMIGSTTGPEVRDLLFERNYCNGGNFTIGIRNDLNATNIVFRDNLFGRDYRYGVVANWGLSGISWDMDSNVYADTGQPVVEP